MAHIRKRILSKGEIKYDVQIRKKNSEYYTASFHSEEDAKVWAWWRESLCDNLENFNVPIKDTMTVLQAVDLKKETIPVENKREQLQYDLISELFLEYYKEDKLISELTFENWIDFTNFIYEKPVFRGSKKEKNKRQMSPVTLRRKLAYFSSVFSNVIKMGVPLENLPLKVIQTYILSKV